MRRALCQWEVPWPRAHATYSGYHERTVRTGYEPVEMKLRCKRRQWPISAVLWPSSRVLLEWCLLDHDTREKKISADEQPSPELLHLEIGGGVSHSAIFPS